MNSRTTYVLMGLVSLLLAGLGIYIAFSDDEKPNVSGLLLPVFAESGIHENDITSLEIENSGKKAVFSRQPGGLWKCTEPLKIRVDATAIDSILRELMTAKVVEKGIDISNDPAKYGLANPEVKITLKKGVDRESTVSIGTITIGQEKALAYVMTSDNPRRVQAIRRSSIQALLKPGQPAAGNTAEMVLGLSDLRERKLLGINMQDSLSQSNSITIKQGKQILSLARQPNGQWIFQAPLGYGEAEAEIPAGGVPNPELIYSVRQLISQATALEVFDPKNFIDNPPDLGKFGLNPDNPDVMKIELTRISPGGREAPTTETLYIGKRVEDPKDPKQKTDEVYVHFEGDDTVAKVNAEGLKFLRKTLEDPKSIRSKDLVRMDLNKVDAIEILNPSGKIELRRGAQANIWSIYDGDNAHAANFTFIQTLLARLTEHSLVQEFPPSTYSAEKLGYTDKSSRVALWENGVPPAKEGEASKAGKPKLKDKPTVELIFGKSELNVVNVRRIMNGQQNDFQIPSNVLDQLVNRNRIEYVDVILKTFNSALAKTITITQGTENLILNQVEGDKWKIGGPEKLKNKPADDEKVRQLITELVNLRPLKTVAEKPDAATLTRLKLDDKSALMKIKIDLKDEKDKERIYYFGVDSESKTGQYLRMADQDYVVEVTKAIYELHKNSADFLDRQVYKIPPDKVTGLKLTGWAKQTGEKPATREFELKEGKWVARTKLNYEIDPPAIANFLLDVTNVKAEEMLGTKEVKPEFNLDLSKGAIEIVLEAEGGKKITLLLGAEDPKSNLIYAKSSEAGGEVFTLLKDRYRVIRDTLMVFKKLP